MDGIPREEGKMRGAKWFKKMLREVKKNPLFEAEGLIIELEEENIKLKKRVEELESERRIKKG